MEELTIDPAVAERSRALTDTRCPQPLGHYEILVPEPFRPVDVPSVLPSNEDSPATLAFFRTEGEPRAELEIAGLFLRREVAPADVLEALLTGEHTILERRRVPSPGGDLLDVLTRSFAGEPWLSRWWTVKDGGSRGGRLYLLEARAPESVYRQHAASLSTMLASFRLLNPAPWDYFERLTSFARKSPNDILCFYPESWQLEVKSEGPLVAHLWQVLGGRLLGRISIVSLAGGRDAALDAFAGTLEGSIDWDAAEASEPFGRLERAWTRRGRAALNETAVELDVHIGERGEGAVALGVVALGDVDPLGQAILRRALEVVRETFRIA